MATTSIWKVEKRIDHVLDYTINHNKTKNINYKNNEFESLENLIDYAKNYDKTEKQFFVTGINCEVDSAYEEMKNTKKYYRKEDKILAYHAYQSFKEGEVTPKKAHEIGVQLAKEIFGDRFEVIVSTHLNTNHIHNHIVINSVSFKDGKKYYSNRTNTAILRHVSDDICRENGLSVLEENECKKSKINFNNYYKKSLVKDNYHTRAKRDIDLAIRQAYSYNDFLVLMKKLEYEIINRSGKLSIRSLNKNKNIRIERSFGEEYSIENIRKRILEEQEVRNPFIESIYNRKVKYPFANRHRKSKAKGFIELYYHYCYLLKIFHNNVPQVKISQSIKKDIFKMEQISEEAKFLSKNKLKTLEDLTTFKDDITFKLNDLLSQRERLWAKRKISKSQENCKSMTNEINLLTAKITEHRTMTKMCERIKERIPNIDKNLYEIEEQIELEKDRKQNKKKGVINYGS